MSRKVVLLGPLPPPYGGVSVYMSALYEHLKSEGVRIWALYGATADRDAQTTFINHRRLGIVRALMREGRGAHILDATHFHFEYPNKVLLLLWIAFKRLLGFRWYKNVLDGSLPARYAHFGLVEKRLFKLAMHHIDEFVVVSDELLKWLREIGLTQKATVIPCLLPIPRRQLERSLPLSLERDLEAYLARQRRVCSIGVFIESYGFADVAAAIERYRNETGDDVGLLLLDGTFACDQEYKRATLAGRDWINVLENVPNNNVYQILKRSDVFARGVRLEGYGISRVEAVWCGIPVVATSVGETRGMLTYEFGDIESLKQQLKLALNGSEQSKLVDAAAVFQREAEQNLLALKQILHVES